jgi:hypothetical protein
VRRCRNGLGQLRLDLIGDRLGQRLLDRFVLDTGGAIVQRMQNAALLISEQPRRLMLDLLGVNRIETACA